MKNELLAQPNLEYRYSNLELSLQGKLFIVCQESAKEATDDIFLLDKGLEMLKENRIEEVSRMIQIVKNNLEKSPFHDQTYHEQLKLKNMQNHNINLKEDEK